MTTTLISTMLMLAALSLLATNGSNSVGAASTPTDLWKSLLINYDATAAPSTISGTPTEVSIGLHVLNMRLNEQLRTITLIMYFRQSWRDSRLTYNNASGSSARLFQLNKIWMPDTFIRTQLEPVKLDDSMVKVSYSGDVFYVKRMYVTLPVMRDGSGYSTSLMVESFGYTMDTLHFGPMQPPVQMAYDLQLPDGIVIQDTVVIDCSENYTSGAYPCHELKFKFTVKQGTVVKYYLIVPGLLVALLSWTSLWFTPSSTGGAVCRVVIALAALLMSINIGFWSRELVLSGSVSLAIIWTGGCMLIAAAVFIETVVIVVLTSRESSGTAAETDKKTQSSNKRGFVDFVAKIAHPIVFVLFLIVFFAVVC